LAVLVIEARERSGAAITARLAVEDHGREALAVPGRVDSAASAGCHRAIREGWAALVAQPDQLFESLGGARNLLRGARVSCGQPAIRLDPHALGVARMLLSQGPLSVEHLAASEPIGGVLAALTCLEIQGLARRRDDGRYEARSELREALGAAGEEVPGGP
jgi:DNA processing protein